MSPVRAALSPDTSTGTSGEASMKSDGHHGKLEIAPMTSDAIPMKSDDLAMSSDKAAMSSEKTPRNRVNC